MSIRPRQQAAIYCRISQDRAGGGLGVARQEKDCRDLASRLGWTVAEVLTDNDVSAYSGKPRPGYKRMIIGVTDGTFDAVLAWHADRLHRSPIELEQFINVVQSAEVAVQTVTAGALDLGTASGQLVARQLGAVARYESQHKSERVRRAMLQRAEAGEPVRGGTRGYGYTTDMEVIPAEAKVIKRMASLVLDQAYTAGQVARWANKAGHTTSAAGPWRPRSVNELLCSARIAGWRSHAPGLRSSSGERIFGLPFTHEGTWAPILERGTIEHLRERLKRNTLTRTRPNRSYLLSGFLWHDKCPGDGRFVGVMKDGVARYRCSPSRPVGHGCGGPQIVGPQTEGVVLDALVFHLGATLGHELADEESEGQVAETLEAIRTAKWALERLGDQLDDDEVTRDDYRRRKARLDVRLEGLRGTLSEQEAKAKVRRPSSLPGWANDAFDRGAFLRWWKDADTDARRAILTHYVEKIEVAPGVRGRKAFDASRLTVCFADEIWMKPVEVGQGTVGDLGAMRIVGHLAASHALEEEVAPVRDSHIALDVAAARTPTSP